MDEYVPTLEEIKRLVELTKEPSWTLPNGLTREEKRDYIKRCANCEIPPDNPGTQDD